MSRSVCCDASTPSPRVPVGETATTTTSASNPPPTLPIIALQMARRLAEDTTTTPMPRHSELLPVGEDRRAMSPIRQGGAGAAPGTNAGITPRMMFMMVLGALGLQPFQLATARGTLRRRISSSGADSRHQWNACQADVSLFFG